MIAAFLAFAAGFALGAIGTLAVSLRSDASAADAWQANYHNECRRHDLSLKQAAAREAEAARHIAALAVTLEQATGAEQAARREPVRVGENLLQRFNWN